MNKYIKIVLAIVVCVVLSSFVCETPTRNPITCIESSGRIGYEVWYETVLPKKLFDVVIPEDWEPQLENEIPISEKYAARDVIITNTNIWINYYVEAVKVNLKTKEMVSYPIPDNLLSISYLYLLGEDEIWGVGSTNGNTSIIRYDKLQDKFVEIEFHDENNEILEKETGYSGFNNTIVERSKNEFWYLYKGKLYLLNSETQKFKLELVDLYSDASIYQIAEGLEKDSLWIFTKDESNNLLLSLYENSQLDVIALLQGGVFDFGVNYTQIPIKTDKNNRTWISNRAWIEPITDPSELSETPNIIKINKQLENQLFVGKSHNYSETYYEPYRINIFSDGSIWYSTGPGIIKLQPETGEYCKVVSGIYADVAEAPEGSIWFVYNGQLYKHEPVN